ncbi:hypothetical protein O4158_20975 [Gordonia amicalis]|uniref:hypothetical protein n=1 Tax=Gordonia amicalis TaxID=89053 RepID=UPI0022B2F186|nr:hypothetical protein [Gordonia amicalis]MCZ4581513.1 hypothetical protein [Gordonia amicalis]
MSNNHNAGQPHSPEVSYRAVFGPGDVHRYTVEAVRLRMCTPGVVVAVVVLTVLLVVAAVALESWWLVALVPADVVGMIALSYWSVRRAHVHVVSPGQYMATGGNDYGLILESDLSRDSVPWHRIAGVRVRRGIAVLTVTGPKAQVLLPAELLPDELLARIPHGAINTPDRQPG